MKWFSLPALCLLAVPVLCPGQGLPLPFKSGDRILLYGNSFVARMQERGRFEAAIHLAHPDKQLVFRSLAWTGDEVGNRLRPERYATHLKKLLAEWPADHVILGGFGWTEAFAGKDGLDRFSSDLRNYLREIQRRHADATIVLMLPSTLPRATAGPQTAPPPKALPLYVDMMRQIGEQAGVKLLDLQEFVSGTKLGNKTKSPYYQELWAAGQLSRTREHPDPNHLRELAMAVSQKASYVSTIVRPINTVVYFGVRARPDEYNAEMPRYHQMAAKADEVIHALAANSNKSFADFPKPTLPPLSEQTKPGREKAGRVLSPADQQQEIRVADGYHLNLFASEEQFPDLKNPVQIAFGPRGRLWVVTMPSFPHTVPGEQPKDKILILEDTDRDGVADKQTVFADGLNVPDGLVFYKDGIIASAQPKLLYMRERRPESKADRPVELLRGIDVTDAHHGGMIAMDPLGHIMLCDGVFHRSQFETPRGVVRGVDATTYRFDPETGLIESEYQTLTPNPWKITHDRWGNLFQMYGDGFVQDSQVIPWTPLGIYHPFKRAISIAYGKGSGAEVISSPNFPDAYQQGMASATLLGKYFVALSKLDPAKGLHAASDRIDVLSSDNPAFRPVDMAFGFDGAMYVSDFCNAIIGHAQNPMRDPRWDHEHGRIWRVVHTGKPLVKEWPEVAGADPAGLLQLLAYPQDNVRGLARVRLRNEEKLATLLDQHLTRQPNLPAELILEFLWLYESKREVRPDLLQQLLDSDDFRFRAAATRLIRFQADRLSNAFELLTKQAVDPHPRVRIEVIKAASYLQQRDLKWASLLGRIDSTGNPALTDMLADASHGTTPAKGPEVPILDIPKESLLVDWLHGNEPLAMTPDGQRSIKEAVIHTYVDAQKAQTAILSVRHQYVRVSVNGVQLLDAETWWSSDWNLQVALRKGLNELEVEFSGGNRAQGIAPVYLFDPLGKPLQGVDRFKSNESLRDAATRYAVEFGTTGESVRLSAVPNQLAFSPREIRLKAGRKITLVFDNPDHQIHNVVITKPGTLEKVGLLADQMALHPEAAKEHYVPNSKDVLWSTPLVDANDKVELEFTAPTEPGRYPILCTFPGHWRVMQATLVVE